MPISNRFISNTDTEEFLLDIVEKTSFDQIYDEHIYYFSGLSISNLAKRHGLKLVDMVLPEVHGGLCVII